MILKLGDSSIDKGLLEKVVLPGKSRVSTGKKLHQCDVCNKSFGHRGHLNIHYRIHTGERPFQCDQCNKAFAQKVNLFKHKLTHSEGGTPKPHKCDLCEMGFRDKTALKRHMRRHTG